MGKRTITFIFFATTICFSCRTYVSGNGSKHRQFLPTKDRAAISDIDTNSFIKLPFNLNDYCNKVAYKNGKRVIETIEGTDLSTIANTKGRYYVYFWNPVCPAARIDIHKMDSLSKKGENVIMISMRSNYDIISNKLDKTSFAQYPCYVLEAEKYTDLLLVRKIRFTKEACESCYEQYKDDLAVADYLLVENGSITPIMYNDTTNSSILKN